VNAIRQVVVALLLTTTLAVADEQVERKMNWDMPPPQDYDAIMMRQFEALTSNDVVAGYELYIARNPDDPLSDVARSRLRWLQDNPQPGAVPPWRRVQ
jgi:hypothetical protein